MRYILAHIDESVLVNRKESVSYQYCTKIVLIVRTYDIICLHSNY